MIENLFMQDEDGVAAVTLPAACCRGADCIDDTNTPLAMAYIPMQKFEDLYDVDQAFRVGTVFKALDMPFLGRKVKRGACK